MTSPDAIVPVPAVIAHRAWECAADMARPDHWRLAPPMSRGTVRWAALRGPDALTWAQCGELFRAHRRVRERRV